MKLYKITLRGMTSCVTGTHYGCPYVVAKGTDEAVAKVQSYLKERDVGFADEREVERIELLAEEGDYPLCKIQLFL